MFIPSDGDNYEIANSYVDVDYADAYFSLRGNTTWIGTDQEKQAALIKATDYIEQTYGQRWIGVLDRSIGLSWPRLGLSWYAYNSIPENLKKATCELAVEALTKDLNPVITPTIKREKVDVIETEYFETKETYPIRAAVIGLLLPLLGGTQFNRKVVRV